jgi:hypothetical protein
VWRRQSTAAAVKEVSYLQQSSTLPSAGGRAKRSCGGEGKDAEGERASYAKNYREISYIGAEIFYIRRVKNLRFM